MAHYPKPFFRPARNLWYVQIDGRQFNLGADQAVAFKNYHSLMQQRAEAKPSEQMKFQGNIVSPPSTVVTVDASDIQILNNTFYYMPELLDQHHRAAAKKYFTTLIRI
jgi:hypothetical protein